MRINTPSSFLLLSHSYRQIIKRVLTALLMFLGLYLLKFVDFTGFSTCMGVMSLVCTAEWYTLCSSNDIKNSLLVSVCVCAGLVLWLMFIPRVWNVLLFGVTQLLLAWFFTRSESQRVGVYQAANLAVFGVGAYLVLLAANASCQMFLKNQLLFLYTVLLTAVADTAGYLCGRFWPYGSPFLRISPRKTWTGTVGMVLVPACLGTMLLWGLALSRVFYWVALGVGACALWGDLAVSVLKRVRGLKHTGTWLPGHGGFFDRLDSHVMVWAWAYFLMFLVDF